MRPAPRITIPVTCGIALFAACGLALASAPGNPDPRTRRRTPVVEVFENTKSAVVNIRAIQVVRVRSSFGFDSFFDDFFDLPSRVREYEQASAGSGFVLHSAGYIVTNAHVVARTAQRKVIFVDKSEYDAEIIAIDHPRDLAILKIDADRPLQPIKLGISSDLMVGETVVAIGNPLGYQHTVTAGVVSALDRSIQVSREVSFSHLIQTDASINPGNSGGPLLNVLGELVGINTAIRADAENIGFAIAVDQLRQLLPEVLDVQRRYGFILGLGVADDSAGCKIIEVTPGSPAATARLKVGSVINKINDTPVSNAIDYHIALIGKKAGDTLTVHVDDNPVRISLAALPRPDGAKLLWDRLGIAAQPLSKDAARPLRLRAGVGLIVTKIDPASPANRARIRRGDILVQIGRHVVGSLDDVGSLLDKVRTPETVTLGIRRVGPRFIEQWTASVEVRWPCE